MSAVHQTSDSTFRSDAHLHPNSDVVVQQMGDQTVLLHLRTNHFYQMNSTAARLWELLSEGLDRDQIQKQLLDEYDVEPAQLADEIANILTSLQEQDLVIAYD